MEAVAQVAAIVAHNRYRIVGSLTVPDCIPKPLAILILYYEPPAGTILLGGGERQETSDCNMVWLRCSQQKTAVLHRFGAPKTAHQMFQQTRNDAQFQANPDRRTREAPPIKMWPNQSTGLDSRCFFAHRKLYTL